MCLKYSASEFAEFPAYCHGMNVDRTTCQMHASGQSSVLNWILPHCWETRNVIHVVWRVTLKTHE